MKHLSLIETAFFLKNTEIFRDLALDLLLAIADKVHQDIYYDKEKIFSIDDRANKIYFVALGSVSIQDVEEKEICERGEEDFFGDEALFSQKIRAYSVLSKNTSLILSIQRSDFLHILSECPSASIALLEMYSENLQNRHLRRIPLEMPE